MVSLSSSDAASDTTVPGTAAHDLSAQRPLAQSAGKEAPKPRTTVQWTSFKKNNWSKSRPQGSQGTSQKMPQTPSQTTPDSVIAVDALAQLPGSIVLPPFRSHTAISQRHEVNPALAMNLLQDLQSLIVTWQKQLRQLVTALHSLHEQGPMVEGWIESSAEVSPISEPDATLFRHGDTDALMKYVEVLSEQPQMVSTQGAAQGNELSDNEPGRVPENSVVPTQYRLCSLDENGLLRSHPCPPEQMGAVSLAIARYQKFKQLMGQKQALDAKLQKAVDYLTGLRATLEQEP